MFTDRKFIVVLEYIIGFCLLIAVLPLFANKNTDWGDAHWWSYVLFIVAASLTLISCASGMKQRIQLSQRLGKIEKTLEELKSRQTQSPGPGTLNIFQSGPPKVEVGSLN